MKLSNRTVLITGGSSGIGLALADEFLKAGNRVAICARNESRLAEARAKRPKLLTRVCDVSKEEDRLQLLKWAEAELPALDILVNNAGIQRDIDFTKGLAEYKSGESEIRTNLEATIELSGLFIPLLSRNPNPAILNVTSGLGFVPAAKMPVYSATKAAVHAFSMALRYQLAPKGIQVVEVVPPAIDTNLNPEGRAKRGGFKAGVGPGEFVAAVMKSLEADEPEIGFGMSSGWVRASRPELDEAFRRLNARM